MRRLNDTIQRLNALRARQTSIPQGANRLTELRDFGSNPGALRAFCHTPARLEENAALVVVLHGCTQDAAAYDRGSGWSELADEQGFSVLFPEQRRANNANLCFNWFNREDTRRDGGEALSIRQMVAAMIATHRLDPARVFVTGLSAGGAMTSVMLATYPEVFAGGAIIAGLPYGTAESMPQALDRMRAQGGPSGAALGALVTAASAHNGRWPSISIWHGTGDMTVSPTNAGLILEQWRRLHGVAEAPSETNAVDGHAHRLWRDAAGREVIEEYRIAGLGHGTPLSTLGSEACGAPGPYMLEAGISSTRHIARFWGLMATEAAHAPLQVRETARADASQPHKADTATGVGRIIEDALRAAGLMR
ncbi:extracellular catalytic domain type 1 short-chain-length polyhydroxyalkanoate depolymerase [Sphingomonas sp. OTU376]|uniref:extracellular catalytic domain type 1 short-chain-length polyhydroxyalkanoate depolymerase n=1 Tax=Sphingomonas sp. OTU376 TaxID=3043863 RepID=UPI00313B5E64